MFDQITELISKCQSYQQFNFQVKKLFEAGNYPSCGQIDGLSYVTEEDELYPGNLRQVIGHPFVIFANKNFKLITTDISICLVNQPITIYSKRVIRILTEQYNVLSWALDKNEMYLNFMYDIIYCNTIGQLGISNDQLQITLGYPIGSDAQAFFCASLATRLFVLEVDISQQSISIVNFCLELGVEVECLPSNVFYSCHQLANKLIAEGAKPIIMEYYKNKYKIRK